MQGERPKNNGHLWRTHFALYKVSNDRTKTLDKKVDGDTSSGVAVRGSKDIGFLHVCSMEYLEQ